MRNLLKRRESAQKAPIRVACTALAIIFLATLFVFIPADQAAAAPKCKHKTTSIFYTSNGANGHTRKEKCKSCGKITSKSSANHSWTYYWKKESYSNAHARIKKCKNCGYSKEVDSGMCGSSATSSIYKTDSQYHYIRYKCKKCGNQWTRKGIHRGAKKCSICKKSY